MTVSTTRDSGGTMPRPKGHDGAKLTHGGGHPDGPPTSARGRGDALLDEAVEESDQKGRRLAALHPTMGLDTALAGADHEAKLASSVDVGFQDRPVIVPWRCRPRS
jgi:hypothetical protein